VVLVGDIPIQIDRADIYRNEIDFFISTSYGPGRYDRSYEEEGLDYPTSYVRWTENRNMSAYLALVAEGKVQPARLVESIYTVDRADEAYQALKRDPSQGARPLALLLAYPDGEDAGPQESESAQTRVRNATGLSAEGTERIQVGLAGAGAFARSVHLPNMSAMKDRYFLRAVMSRTAHLAQTTAKTQRAEYATTDYADLLKDDNISLLLIASRHDTHGDYVLRGLKAGKHVFVEKPLCLTVAELADIEAFYADAGDDVPVLMTGFNRRFAPGIRPLVSALKERSGPMMVDYRMNAGHIPLDNWVHGAQGGGRNLGEACHIYDLFTALVGARCISVKAHAIRPQPGHLAKNDNFVATLRYDDGSICTLTYTALGASGWAKERLDVFCDGKVYALDDYKQLQSTTSLEWSGSVDKGHKAELNELADCLLGAGQWPIALWEQVQATSIALQVEEAIHADSYP
jgi:predicted dehydrogenase